jgi:hypothetical protein
LLLAFARAVRLLPETRCAGDDEPADFVDALDATTWSAYQRGDFSREGSREPQSTTRRPLGRLGDIDQKL